MKKLLLFLLPVFGLAQTLAPSVSPSSVRAGQTTTVTHTLTPSATAPVSAVQSNTAGLPTAAFAAWTAGAATTAAGKTTSGQQSAELTAGTSAASATTALGAGPVASSVVTVPANTPPGIVTISVAGALGASPTGQPVVITAGPAAVLTVLDPKDVNGDGKVDASDLAIVKLQALGVYFGQACTIGDVNGDGQCDITDVQLVAKAIP